VKARRGVVEAIGGFRRAENLKVLQKALDAKDSYYVPAEACRAIGKTRSHEAEPILKKQLAVESWNDTIRAGAVDGFAALNVDHAVEILIDHSKLGRHVITRGSAVRGLGAVGKGRPDVTDHLVKLLDDPNLRVQSNSIVQLGSLGDPRAVAPLEKVAELKDVDGRLRRLAEESIRQIREGLDTGPDVDALKKENERLKKQLGRRAGQEEE